MKKVIFYLVAVSMVSISLCSSVFANAILYNYDLQTSTLSNFSTDKITLPLGFAIDPSNPCNGYIPDGLSVNNHTAVVNVKKKSIQLISGTEFGLRGYPINIAFSPDGKLMYLFSETMLQIFDNTTTPRTRLSSLNIYSNDYKTMKLSPYGSTLYLVDPKKKEIMVIDVKDHKLPSITPPPITIPTKYSDLTALTFGTTGEAYVGTEKKIFIIKGGKITGTIPVPCVSQKCLTVSHDGKTLYTISAESSGTYSLSKVPLPYESSTIQTCKITIHIPVGMTIGPYDKTLYILESNGQGATPAGYISSINTTNITEKPLYVSLAKLGWPPANSFMLIGPDYKDAGYRLYVCAYT